MKKFKLAQNKTFIEAAPDMWTLRDTSKLLNSSFITATFQVFCQHFKNIFLKLYKIRKMNTISWVQRTVRSLLACYTSTSKSLRTQFWHDISLRLVHIEVHFNLYVTQVHQIVYSILQPHLIVFRSSWGAEGFVICTGRHIPFDIFHLHCLGGKSFLHQLWTVW